MRYYFAGAYERRAELKAYAERLHAARIGAMVLSRWLTQDQTGEDAAGRPARRARLRDGAQRL
jgi:hypothetical protein